MVKAINSKIALLRILKPFIPTKELGNIGSSSYGAPVWGSTSKCNINRLQKCQTNAARVILRETWQIGVNKTHRQDLMQTLGWQNVNQLVATSMLNLTKSALDGASSKDVNKMFKMTPHTNPRLGHAPRISHQGKISDNNKTFEIEAVQLYNNLPPQLRCTELKKKQFKGILKGT